MLSALIPSIHSYPAIHLVAKPVDQRYVQPSPLVDYTTHYCVLRLYLHPSIRMEGGVGILWRLKSAPSVSVQIVREQVVTGSNLKLILILLWIASVVLHSFLAGQLKYCLPI